ncbi:hypothetical protein C8J57DRAFT_1524347 [Mycena rebaudengoi]|nr:hypothetical protein C8J57DRAFT_1524347 [Mycena rebaudengoi]
MLPALFFLLSLPIIASSPHLLIFTSVSAPHLSCTLPSLHLTRFTLSSIHPFLYPFQRFILLRSSSPPYGNTSTRLSIRTPPIPDSTPLLIPWLDFYSPLSVSSPPYLLLSGPPTPSSFMTLHLPSHFADRPDFSPVTEDLSLSTIKNYQVSIFPQLRRPLLCSLMTSALFHYSLSPPPNNLFPRLASDNSLVFYSSPSLIPTITPIPSAFSVPAIPSPSHLAWFFLELAPLCCAAFLFTLLPVCVICFSVMMLYVIIRLLTRRRRKICRVDPWLDNMVASAATHISSGHLFLPD